MKHFKTLFKLLSILIVFTITFTACNEDDELKPGETPQQAANRICPVGEGFNPEKLNTTVGLFSLGPSEIYHSQNSTLIYMLFNGIGPRCEVFRVGIAYTTDGSEPKLDNPNTKIILNSNKNSSLKPSISGSYGIYTNSGYPNGILNFKSNSEPNIENNKLSASYNQSLNAYIIGPNQFTDTYLNLQQIPDYFSNTNPHPFNYYAFLCSMERSSYPELDILDGSNVSYRGFMQSLKDNDVVYTPVTSGVNPLPTAINLEIEDTNDNLVKTIKADITTKKAVNGYIYTTENSAFAEFFTNQDISNWIKVFVPDTEITANSNNPEMHKFSVSFNSENNKQYTFIAFTSDDNLLTPANTKFSALRGFNTSAGKPTVDVSATTTNNSITLTGNIQSNGNTAVTAYGLKLFGDASYTTVIAENNQTGSATGPFSLTKDALNPNTTYYAEVYATNSVGTGNKRIEVTTNAVLPTLTIANPTSPDAFSSKAQFNAQITNNGSAIGTVTNYGFELTNPNTTVTQINQAETSGSLSNFSRLQENLTVGNYSVRAFAINSAGTAYSESKPFTISATVVLPTVTIDQPTTDVNDVTLVGHVTNNGNGTITNFTFEIFDEFDQEIPVIQSNVTGNAATFTYTFDSMGVDNIRVRAKATNSAGTGVSDEIFYSVF